MVDFNCPYCGKGVGVDKSEGDNFIEDTNHQMECPHCKKNFVFVTSLIWHFEPYKADCLNDGNHRWGPTHTHPKDQTMMECHVCGERRKPTEEEREIIMKTQ